MLYQPVNRVEVEYRIDRIARRKVRGLWAFGAKLQTSSKLQPTSS